MVEGMKILITGGSGYIGSHACVAAIDAGYEPVVVDSLVNSSPVAIDRVAEITGQRPALEVGDINDRAFLEGVFRRHTFMAVIHMAGLKAVGESCEQPLRYYQNNVGGAMVLCDVMEEYQVGVLIFSSSATVYGDSAKMPVSEEEPTGATNPYGMSKLMIEYILNDLVQADKLNNRKFWNIACLRYFNPIGAHPSGLIGEDPRNIPNNLAPYISQAAIGKLKELSVFGDTYPTTDGTGVRDYIHVMDLVGGHIAALDSLLKREGGLSTWNLGTGRGYSVLQMIAAFEAACGHSIPYKIVGKRSGDIAECWADSSKALKDLGWRATRSLQVMVEDAWRWQSDNPDGFK